MGIPQLVRIPTRWKNFDKNFFLFFFLILYSKMFPSLVIDFCLNMAISSMIGVFGVNEAPATSESVREAENTLDRPVVIIRPTKTFLYVKEKMNWADARHECKQRGGDLASLTSLKDFDLIYTKIEEKGHWIWVGGKKTENKDRGTVNEDWLTGEPFSYHEYFCRRELYDRYTSCLATMNGTQITRRNGDPGPCLATGVCTDSRAFVCKFY